MRGTEPTWHSAQDVAGGMLLRQLRQAAGLSLIELAGRLDDAGFRIDAAHLQRIESGRIARPTVDTLEAILTVGLNVLYRTRRDVLDAFGYRLPWELPSEREIAEGRRLCARELHGATWPVHLMDHGQRLWDWNRHIPRLLGLPPDDPTPNRFVGLTLLDVTFNPAIGTNLLIANREAFLPEMLHMFKVQTQPHADQPWFLELIERARDWPGFAAMWDNLPDDPDEMLATEQIVPIHFSVPGVDQPLRFRIVMTYLTVDPRFQVMHWVPYGAATLRQVAMWAEEDGEP
jgi:transcriptional regulator with XRE-family HTH domain